MGTCRRPAAGAADNHRDDELLPSREARTPASLWVKTFPDKSAAVRIMETHFSVLFEVKSQTALRKWPNALGIRAVQASAGIGSCSIDFETLVLVNICKE